MLLVQFSPHQEVASLKIRLAKNLHRVRPLNTMSEIELDIPGKRERTKAANREAILEAARKVFAELGFEATTVRDIIRGTDLASGTFYNYFKSKEEVFDALARESLKRFRPYLKQVREESETFESYLRGALIAFFRYLVYYRDDKIAVRSATQQHMVEVRVDTPEMQAIFDEIRRDIEDFLQRQGQHDIDTEYLTAAAIGLARELGDRMLFRLGEDTEKTVLQAAEFATNLILNGVRTLFDTQAKCTNNQN